MDEKPLGKASLSSSFLAFGFGRFDPRHFASERFFWSIALANYGLNQALSRQIDNSMMAKWVLDVEQKMANVTVLDDVVFAFDS